MALTYVECSNLMEDPAFRGRIKVAGLHYATYILAESPNVAGHNSRYRWAQNMGQQPDMVAAQLQPLVVMDGAVQSEGADIDDGELQTAVENVINKMI